MKMTVHSKCVRRNFDSRSTNRVATPTRSYGCTDTVGGSSTRLELAPVRDNNRRDRLLTRTELSASWRQSMRLCAYAGDASARRRELEHPEDLISTAESTPTKEETIASVAQHLIGAHRRVRRHVPGTSGPVVDVPDAGDFLGMERSTSLRSAFSAPDTGRVSPVVQQQHATAMQLCPLNAQEYDNRLEALDAKRVRSGNAGLMKFATMLGKGQLSQADQDGYWTSIASRAHHQVTTLLNHMLDVARHNMTEHQRMCVAISLQKRKRLFDRGAREMVMNSVHLLKGKSHKVRTELVAQGRFSDVVRNVPGVGSLMSISENMNAVVENGISVHMTHSFDWMLRLEDECSHAFVIRTITMICTISTMSTWLQRSMVLLQYLASFNSVCVIISRAVGGSAQVYQRLVRDDNMVAQASQQDVESVFRRLDGEKESLVAAFCGVIAGAFKLETPAETFRTITRARRISSLASICKSATTIVNFLQDCITCVYETAQAQAKGMDYTTYKMYCICPQYREYRARVTALYLSGGVVRARTQCDTAVEVRQLFARGNEIFDVFKKAQLTSYQLQSMQRTEMMIREMYAGASQYFESHRARTEPVLIHLIGQPGVGKSSLIDFLARDICQCYLLTYDASRDIFSKNMGDKYWEGYANQRFVILDDMFQSKNPNDLSAEAMEIIRIKNTVPYPLNMAAVASKGVTLFTSPVVFVTSNVDIPDNLPISAPTAVKRRRDIVVEVQVAEEFRDSRGFPDPLKVASITGMPKSDQIYRFTVIDCITGDKLQEDLDYDAFRTMVREVLLDKRPAGFSDSTISTPSPNLTDRANGSMVQLYEMQPVGDLRPLSDSDFEVSESSGTTISENDIATFFETMNAPRPQGDIVKMSKKELGFSDEGWKVWRQYLADCALSAKAWSESAWEAYIKPNLTALNAARMLGIVAAALVAYAMMRKIGQVPAQQSESFSSGDEKTRYRKRDVVVLGDPSTDLVAQASPDRRGVALLRMVFVPMLCRVTVYGEADSHMSVHGLLIGGKIIVLPAHLFLLLDWKASDVVVEGQTGTYQTHASRVKVFRNWVSRDLAVVEMPGDFPCFPKRTKHFVEERDLGRFPFDDLYLLMCGFDDEVGPAVATQVQKPLLRGPITYAMTEGSPHKVQLARCIQYEAPTEQGDCGAPLLWLHPSVNRKILGFHVAGGGRVGTSTILTHELMEDIIKTVGGTVLVPPPVDEVIPTLRDGIEQCAQMYVMGISADRKWFRQPSRSEIIPSAIHGVFEPTTGPAVLQIRDGISPLELGIRKGVSPLCYLPPDDLAIVEMQIRSHYAGGRPGMEPRVLTVSEGLNGVEGNPWVRPLNMNTSPGAPYIFLPRAKGKRSFVSFVEGKWEYTPELLQRVQERIELAREGQIPQTLFVDVLKDERRELGKIAEMNTRIFNTCPVDLNIAIRMYFGAFAAFIMENHIMHEIAVGINCHSDSWGALFNRLSSKGRSWIAGDYSKYDKTFPRALMHMVARLANHFYQDGNDQIRITLMETLSSRFHLANKVIYYVAHGNPSGNPLTVIINSLGNMALMRLAWLKLSREHCPALELDFEDHVALTVYGDDNLACVSDQAPWYNMISIAHALGAFGVKYTPPKVNYFDDVGAYMSVNEITYLKRSFRKDRGRMFAPLPMSVIQEIVNWVRVSNDTVEATLDNIQAAQREMFHHGQAAYEQFAETILRACARNRIAPRLIPYGYLVKTWNNPPAITLLELIGKKDLSRGVPALGSAPCHYEAAAQPQPGCGFDSMVAQAKKITKNNRNRSSIGGTAQKLQKRNVAKTTRTEVVQQGTSNGSNARNTTNGTPVVVQINTGKTKQLAKRTEGVSMRVRGTDLICRVDALRKMAVFNMLPGHMGVERVDNVASLHSWAKHNVTPKISYKPLTDITTGGIWYYRIIHDATAQVLYDASTWDISSKAFTAQKASLPFTISFPSSAWKSGTSSPLATDRSTVVIMVHSGSSVDPGEFYMTYDITLGGVSAPVTQSTIYEVKKGKFYDPMTGKEMPGIPVVGNNTSYTFANPISTTAAREILDSVEGVPTTIVRPENEDIVTKVGREPKIEQMIVSHSSRGSKPHWAKRFLNGLDQAVQLGQKHGPAIRTAYRTVKPFGQKLLAALGNSKRSVRTEIIDQEDVVMPNEENVVDSPWAAYDGIVVVSDGRSQRLRWNSVPSIPLLLEMSEDTESDTGSTRVAIPFLPLIGAVVGGLTTVATDALISTIAQKTARTKNIVHKGVDAVSFAVPSDFESHVSYPDEFPEDSTEELPNPLPDIPVFDEDPVAPGKNVPWDTTLMYCGGLVVDQEGTPVTKWMGYWPTKPHVDSQKYTQNLVEPPSPMYYSNIDISRYRRGGSSSGPNEPKKRMLSMRVPISEVLDETMEPAMNGMYIVCWGYIWGDDGTIEWDLNIPGATYGGTIGYFGAISMFRTIVRVDDAKRWNSAPVHLHIGQSRKRLTSSFDIDDGRTCMFTLAIGAVMDGRIADNFITSWQKQSLVRNKIWKGQAGNMPQPSQGTMWTDKHTVSRSAALPAGLEPFAPGFAENYKSFVENGRSARSLPIVVEAGPILLAYGGRVDEANGWWQYFPYFDFTQTDFASRWSIEHDFCALTGETRYRKQSTTYCGMGFAARVTPPANLLSGATIAVESIGVAGNVERLGAGVTFSNSTDPGSVRYVTHTNMCFPVSISRTFSAAANGRYIFPVAAQAKKEPVDAIPHDSKDLYPTGIHVMYLLKSNEAAASWAHFDRRRISDAGDASRDEVSAYNCLINTLVKSGGLWAPGAVKWPDTAGWGFSYSPIHESCPLLTQKGGRSLELRVNALLEDIDVRARSYDMMTKRCGSGCVAYMKPRSKNGGIPDLTEIEEETAEDLTLPGCDPSAPGMPVPEEEEDVVIPPTPEPEEEVFEPPPAVDDLGEHVEVLVPEHIPVPDVSKATPVLDDRYAITRFSFVNKQTGRSAYYGKSTTDTWTNALEFRGFSYTGTIEYHDARGIVPVSGETIGLARFNDFNYSSSSSKWLVSTGSCGTSDKYAQSGGYIMTTPIGVPKIARGNNPFVVAQMWRCGKFTWMYTPDARLKCTALFQGNAWFQFGDTVYSQSVGSTSKTSYNLQTGNTSTSALIRAVTPGHTHPFRKRRCQIFVPAAMDQRVHDYYNNWICVLLELDMADPNAEIGDVVNKLAILQDDSFAPLQQGVTIVSTDSYDNVLQYCMSILPPMLEFQGKFGDYETGVSTYNTPEAPPLDIVLSAVLDEQAEQNGALQESSNQEAHEQPVEATGSDKIQDGEVSLDIDHVETPDGQTEPPPKLAGEDVESSGIDHEPPATEE